MHLLFKAIERKLIITTVVRWWYESNWFRIVRSWWEYTIKKWDDVVSISNNTHHMSKEYKNFNKLLWEFLEITFPK